VPLASEFSRAARRFLRFVGRPIRGARGRGGIVLLPYRGYGSRERAFLIGRVFRQRGMTPVQGPWDIRRQVRDVIRRMIRRPVAGVPVAGRLLGAEATGETDADGYFRLTWTLPAPPPDGARWHPVALALAGDSDAIAEAEVYIPPPGARFVVISDIDDTVMHTGVANKLAMTWRLFVQSARSRTAFPGVSTLYRALHEGTGGDEGNPMIYVSRAPWGIYDILSEFFRRHDIPEGPVLLLREWGLSWCEPGAAPRRGPQARADRACHGDVPRPALRADRRQRPARPGDLPRGGRAPRRARARRLHPRRLGPKRRHPRGDRRHQGRRARRGLRTRARRRHPAQWPSTPPAPG
jgi:phosphatidate phosphatase APP1